MAKPKADKKPTARTCPRAHFHRPGSYCKFCQKTTPSK